MFKHLRARLARLSVWIVVVAVVLLCLLLFYCFVVVLLCLLLFCSCCCCCCRLSVGSLHVIYICNLSNKSWKSPQWRSWQLFVPPSQSPLCLYLSPSLSLLPLPLFSLPFPCCLLASIDKFLWVSFWGFGENFKSLIMSRSFVSVSRLANRFCFPPPLAPLSLFKACAIPGTC